MRDNKRLHRNDSARVGPRRSFAGLYGVSEAPGSAPPSSENLHNGNGPQAGATDSDQAASTVRAAYQVIEKYLEQGQAAAQQFSRQPYASWMTGEGAQQLIDGLLRVQYEMLPVWLEAVNNVMRSAARPAAPPHPAPGAANGTSSVTLDISAERPVEVSVELRGLMQGMDPGCMGARALEPGKPDITDITIDSSRTPGRSKVSIRVPPDQPPGQYSGVIVDRKSGNVCGTISLRIAGR